MQQLTLQFEGFAQTGHSIDAKAPAREVQVKASVARVVNRAKEWCQLHKEQLEDTAMGTAIMVAGVFVLFMAAVLQGGAV